MTTRSEKISAKRSTYLRCYVRRVGGEDEHNVWLKMSNPDTNLLLLYIDLAFRRGCFEGRTDRFGARNSND